MPTPPKPVATMRCRFRCATPTRVSRSSRSASGSIVPVPQHDRAALARRKLHERVGDLVSLEARDPRPFRRELALTSDAPVVRVARVHDAAPQVPLGFAHPAPRLVEAHERVLHEILRGLGRAGHEEREAHHVGMGALVEDYERLPDVGHGFDIGLDWGFHRPVGAREGSDERRGRHLQQPVEHFTDARPHENSPSAGQILFGRTREGISGGPGWPARAAPGCRACRCGRCRGARGRRRPRSAQPGSTRSCPTRRCPWRPAG